MLQIYNSLTRRKEEFRPIQANKIGMYVCGITVYDYCHLGHARVMVAFDVITRYLRSQGYEVDFVRNITDIDDKIIKRANENKESIDELTSRFITAMHEDFAALHILPPNHEPRATQHIDEIIYVRLGDITLHEVDVAVQENNMPVVLLGMSFLNRVEMKRAGDTMTLKKRY